MSDKIYDDPGTTVDESKIYDETHDNGSDGGSDAGGKVVASLVAGILLILIFPFMLGVLAFVFIGYALLRWGKLKRSVISCIYAPFVLLSIWSMTKYNFPGILASTIASFKISSIRMIGDAYKSMLGVTFWPLFLAGMGVGSIVGMLAVFFTVFKMKKQPAIVMAARESWMYHFRFRQTPIEALKYRKTLKELKEGTYVPYGNHGLNPLGVEENPISYQADPTKIKLNRVICRSPVEATSHTIVTGGTGSGKSTTLKELVLHDMKHDNTVFFIDCKNDPSMACSLAHMAKEFGYEFLHFSVNDEYRVKDNPLGPASYDPLAHGTVSVKTNMLVDTREWDSSAAVYRESAIAYLSKIFRIIEQCNKLGVFDKIPQIDNTQGEFYTFTQMLDRNILNSVVVALNNDDRAVSIRRMASEINALLSPSNRSQDAKNLQHTRDQYALSMSGLMSSEYGRWLKHGGSVNGRNIDLFKLASEKKKIVLFSLQATSQGDRGTEIGSMICNDLTNMTSIRGNAGQMNPISIYIDEFQSLPPTCVSSMVAKARSANASLILAFQSPEQIIAQTGSDAFYNSLMDTCSNFIFHSGSNYDVGMMAAKIIGTEKVPVYSIQKRTEQHAFSINWDNNRNLNSSSHEEDQWILDPSEFTKLAAPMPGKGIFKSEAIFIRKKSNDPVDKGKIGPTAHKISVIAPVEAFTDYYDPTIPPIDIDDPINGAVTESEEDDDSSEEALPESEQETEENYDETEQTMDKDSEPRKPVSYDELTSVSVETKPVNTIREIQTSRRESVSVTDNNSHHVNSTSKKQNSFLAKRRKARPASRPAASSNESAALPLPEPDNSDEERIEPVTSPSYDDGARSKKPRVKLESQEFSL